MRAPEIREFHYCELQDDRVQEDRNYRERKEGENKTLKIKSVRPALAEVGPTEASCCFRMLAFPLRWGLPGELSLESRAGASAALRSQFAPVRSAVRCGVVTVTWEDDCREFLSHRSVSSQWSTPQEVTVGWRFSLKKGTVSFCWFVSLWHGSTPRECEHTLGTCWTGVSQLPARTQLGGWVEAPSGPSAVI